MNQILFTQNNNFSPKINHKKFLKMLKLQFFISIIILICLIFYFLYLYYTRNEKEKLSKVLLNNFNIEKIYAKSQNYTTTSINENNDFFVIGIIEIPKIQLKYPILSNTTDDTLKISPSRFYGPYPNEAGNLCIAAHNYDDNRFFGGLNKLSIGDDINIYDLKNRCITYYIYDKFEISESDISCTNQNTMGKREITLVTCNNITKDRLVVKSKEKQENF